MNKRQALKAAAAHIEELEDWNRRATADIKVYNKCIDGMIAGKSPCEWCEEKRSGECTNENKDGKGCAEWWLLDINLIAEDEKGDADDGEGIPEEGNTGRIGHENITGAAPTL